jgi:hypothetical protein
MRKKKPANTQTTGKRGGKTKTSWKPGQSGNPAGAPKRGESWKEIIDRIGEMTPIEAAEHAKAIAAKFKPMGDRITLKEAVVIRVYADLLFQPSPGMLNTFMERTEGKVQDSLQVDGVLNVENLIEVLGKVYGKDNDKS